MKFLDQLWYLYDFHRSKTKKIRGVWKRGTKSDKMTCFAKINFFAPQFFFHICLFWQCFEISKLIFFVIFVFFSKKFFFPVEVCYCPPKNILRSIELIQQKLFQKVQPPPPTEQPIWGGLKLNTGFSRQNSSTVFNRQLKNSWVAC